MNGSSGIDQDAFLSAVSVKGIGKKTAACLLLFTDSLRDFPTAKQLAKFIGIAPCVNESGGWKGRSSISKRGNSLLRSLLYNCAKSAKRFNSDCKELYNRLREKGKPHKIAMIAVAHRLVRQVFATVKNKTMYEDGFLQKNRKKIAI